jgi:triacylglycerol lipase
MDNQDAFLGIRYAQVSKELSHISAIPLNIVRNSGLTKIFGLRVVVWIHGGRFNKGGGSDKRYNYSYAAQDSVNMGKPFIGVTINCRLSV